MSGQERGLTFRQLTIQPETVDTPARYEANRAQRLLWPISGALFGFFVGRYLSEGTQKERALMTILSTFAGFSTAETLRRTLTE